MASLDIQKTIDKAKEDFQGQTMVAFLGDTMSGKTVTTALIKDTVTQYLETHTNNEYYGTCTDGSEKMNEIIKMLYSQRFPPKTYVDQATPVTIEIHSKSGAGGVMEIILRDVAGEKGEDLLEKEMDVDERLAKIFKISPIQGKPYGALTHLIFAKIYVILIDCSKHKDWSFKQAYIKDIISHLHEIKVQIGAVHNNKIVEPIAIIFSKYDTLKKIEQKPANDLMKELKEVNTALKIYHDSDAGVVCFLSKVESTPLTKKEIDEEIKRVLEEKNEDKKEAQQEITYKQAEKTDAKNRFDSNKKQVVTAQQKLDKVTPTADPAQIATATKALEVAQSDLENTEQEYTEAVGAFDNARKNLSEINQRIMEGSLPPAEKLGISTFRPNSPLTYNKDDYLDLIMWLITKHKKIRGY